MKYFSTVLFFLTSIFAFSQNNCNDAFQYCGNNVTLPLDTTGSDLGQIDCIQTTPNPTWFFFEINQGGNVMTQITGMNQTSSGLDIDVVVAGPYSSLNCTQIATDLSTGNAIVYCDYSTSGVNSYTINAVQAGEFYVIVVTNFSNQAGYAEFLDQGSTAGFVQTNCISALEENNPADLNFVISNPCYDYLSVTGLPEKDYQFRVYDLTGREILFINGFENSLVISLDNITSGIYISELICEDRKITKKFIKSE